MSQHKSKESVKHFLNDFYTEQEAKEVINLMKEGNLDQEMKDVWEEANNIHLTQEKYLSEAYAITGKQKQYIQISRKKLIRAMAAVASIAALIIIGFLSTEFYEMLKQGNVEYTELATSYGETKSITLSDGTKVTLNACSNISFPKEFSKEQRAVRLTGEAFFEVKPNKDAPFIVSTSEFDVKVLGTEFNVKAYTTDEIQTVDVEKGKVQVDMPEAMVRLVASEGLNINTLSHEHHKLKEDREIALWMEGNLEFNRTPIQDVARELERVFNYQVSFQDGQAFENIISGQHTNKNIESILKSIELTTGIHYKHDIKNRTIILFQ